MIDDELTERFERQVDPVQQKVIDYVKYSLSKEMWLNNVRILENMKRSIVAETNSIEAIIEFAYCTFMY